MQCLAAGPGGGPKVTALLERVVELLAAEVAEVGSDSEAQRAAETSAEARAQPALESQLADAAARNAALEEAAGSVDTSGAGSSCASSEREARVLMTFCKAAEHFRVERVLGSGCNGIAFAVKCVHPEAPHPDKTYTLKVGALLCTECQESAACRVHVCAAC